MRTEDKQILLQDLCARLPYGVILQLNLFEGEMIVNSRLTGIDEDGNITVDIPADCAFSIEDAKLYLRPMSSMTEMEKQRFNLLSMNRIVPDGFGEDVQMYSVKCIDWLNKHYLDYRGLIEKGLALEAPEGMYEIKNKIL